MTPDQWQKIDEVFQRAVTLDASERGIFLDEVCAEDQFVRSRVEAMLASDATGWDLIEQTALEAGAPLFAVEQDQLESGQRIRHYEILRLIGRGGMGEVYLAQDQKLNRHIALKLLPCDYAKHRDRLRRFEHEAKAVSALNHPNILTIHELGEIDGQPFIATEFVDGETLRQRMTRDKLTSTEALDITIQITAALAAAHQVGIVHRDIKPENIMIRPDGYLKLLDFGLAKLAGHSDGHIKTLTSEQVDISSGLLMGTVKYMSPEQARGLSVDARSDIFSVGVILYEMLAGRPPFAGTTPRDVANAIAEDNPTPISKAAPVPPEFERIVNKTLNKDKSERYATAENLLKDLKQLRRTLEQRASLQLPLQVDDSPDYLRTTSTIEPAITQFTINKSRLAMTLVILAMAIGLAAYALRTFVITQAVSFENVKTTKLETATGLGGGAALSPDGSRIAYSDDKGVWLSSVDGSNKPTPVAQFVDQNGDDVNASGLVFSEDGRSLYYTRTGDVFSVRLDGNNSAVKVLSSVHSGVAVSPDGRQLAFIRLNPSEGESALMVANADGSEEKRIATRKEPVYFFPANSPEWSPDGSEILVIVEGGSVNASTITAFDVASGEESRISTPAEWPRFRDVAWLSDRSIVVIVTEGGPTSDTQIWHLAHPGWQAKRITPRQSSYESVSVARSTNALMAVERESRSDIWIAPMQEGSVPMRLTNTLTAGRAGLCSMPDGRIVYHSRERGSDGIWLMNADGSNRQNLTPETHGNFYPSVSADGRYVVFMSRRTGVLHVWRLDTTNGQQLQITNGSDEQFPQVSADGKHVYYVSWQSGVGSIWRVSINGGQPSPVVNENSNHPQLSADGRLLTYVTFDDTKLSRKVVAVEDQSLKHTFEGALSRPRIAHWSHTGAALLYLDQRNGVWNVWSQPLSGESPDQLTRFHDGRIYYFAPSHDGKSLVLSRGTESRSLVLFSP